MSAPFAATKFDREYAICDEDCAEFLSGARFDIPFPPKQSDSATLRQMRDALQKAWIILDGLRSYRDDAELLANMPGFGDSATWPAISNHGDPRNDDEPADEVDQAQDLIGEIREQIDRAEAAVCRRDWQTYRIAILNVHDLSRSLFQ